jgi:hypothetical protein
MIPALFILKKACCIKEKMFQLWRNYFFLIQTYLKESRQLRSDKNKKASNKGCQRASRLLKVFVLYFIMKKIGSLLDKRKLARKINVDQESIFYVFGITVKEEYGKQGLENIKPVAFKDKKIFIKTTRPVWDNEILLQKKQIIKKLNQQLGGDEISDLAISN